MAYLEDAPHSALLSGLGPYALCLAGTSIICLQVFRYWAAFTVKRELRRTGAAPAQSGKGSNSVSAVVPNFSPNNQNSNSSNKNSSTGSPSNRVEESAKSPSMRSGRAISVRPAHDVNLTVDKGPSMMDFSQIQLAGSREEVS